MQRRHKRLKPSKSLVPAGSAYAKSTPSKPLPAFAADEVDNGRYQFSDTWHNEDPENSILVAERSGLAAVTLASIRQQAEDAGLRDPQIPESELATGDTVSAFLFDNQRLRRSDLCSESEKKSLRDVKQLSSRHIKIFARVDESDEDTLWLCVRITFEANVQYHGRPVLYVRKFWITFEDYTTDYWRLRQTVRPEYFCSDRCDYEVDSDGVELEDLASASQPGLNDRSIGLSDTFEWERRDSQPAAQILSEPKTVKMWKKLYKVEGGEGVGELEELKQRSKERFEEREVEKQRRERAKQKREVEEREQWERALYAKISDGWDELDDRCAEGVQGSQEERNERRAMASLSAFDARNAVWEMKASSSQDRIAWTRYERKRAWTPRPTLPARKRPKSGHGWTTS